jgi:hypothetical protein
MPTISELERSLFYWSEPDGDNARCDGCLRSKAGVTELGPDWCERCRGINKNPTHSIFRTSGLREWLVRHEHRV